MEIERDMEIVAVVVVVVVVVVVSVSRVFVLGLVVMTSGRRPYY